MLREHTSHPDSLQLGKLAKRNLIPAPLSSGPLSNTTRAHSLSAEPPIKSSASPSVLHSKMQDVCTAVVVSIF